MSKIRQIIMMLVLALLLGLGLLALDHRLSPSLDEGRVSRCSGNDAPKKPVKQRDNEIPKDFRPPAQNLSAPFVSTPYRATVRLEGEVKGIAGVEIKWFCRVVETAPYFGSIVTDDRGEFFLKLKKPGKISIELQSDKWFALREHEFPSDGSALVVKAIRCVSISVLIRCQGGETFQGRGRIADKSPLGQPSKYQQWFRAQDNIPVKLSGVPQLGDFVITVDETMIAYGEFKHVVTRDEVVEGQSIIITLPRGKSTKGQVDLDLSGYTGKWAKIVAKMPGDENSGTGNGQTDGRQHWTSDPISPGTYIIRIDGRPCWESDRFTIEAGKVTVVQFVDRPLAEVRVQLMDEQGSPVKGGVFSRDIIGYFWFERRSPERGIYALSDKDGLAVLDTVGVGKQQFLVEAPGFQPHSFDLDITGGEVRDVGRIVLKPARGRIVLKLVGLRENQKYGVVLRRPRGGGAQWWRPSARIEYVFDLLPYRPYEIIVSAGSGGDTAQRTVTPTETQPEIILEIDVSELEPAK